MPYSIFLGDPQQSLVRWKTVAGGRQRQRFNGGPNKGIQLSGGCTSAFVRDLTKIKLWEEISCVTSVGAGGLRESPEYHDGT